MPRETVDDGLWAEIEPLIPKKPRRFRFPGRKRLDDRKVLTGILFVLKTGIPWEDIPKEMGCTGMTCWRRLRDWEKAGVLGQLHKVLLAKLQGAEKIDWERAVVDSSSIRAVGGGEKDGAKSHGPKEAGKQASRRRRWRWHPFGMPIVCRQSQRRVRAAAAGGGNPANFR